MAVSTAMTLVGAVLQHKTVIMATFMDDRTNEMGMFNYAVSYIDAARELSDACNSGRLTLSFDATIGMLIGHSIELGTKSFLRSKGESLKVIKALRHNLLELLTKATAKGLVTSASIDENIDLEILNEWFGQPPYKIRYIETGSCRSFDDRRLIGFADRLLADVRPVVQESYRQKYG